MSVPVEILGVSHRYTASQSPALVDVSLNVPAACLTTILGPSGSGKSTLLGVVAGTIAPTAGDVRFDGRSILGVPAGERGIALVLQRPYLFPYLTVGENVAFGLAARGVPRAERAAIAARWLDRVGLDGMAPRRPASLSGGEQQRVALVRALAVEPAVLLLDEPFSSLDAEIRLSMQDMLRQIVHDTGVTTLMVSHDLGEAMSLGRRTLLLDGGHAVAEGPSDQVYCRPATVTAARLVGVRTIFTATSADARLHTAAGPLVAPAFADLRGPVTVAIRPEHVVLATELGANRVEGTVRSVTFRGEYWDVTLDTALGMLQARTSTPPAIDVRARAVLDPDALFRVADTDRSAGGG